MTTKASTRPSTAKDLKIRKDNFVAALAHIETFPEHHNQDRYRCGSSYCFGGWAIQVAGYKWFSPDIKSTDVLVPIAQVPETWTNGGPADLCLFSPSRSSAVLHVEFAAYLALGIDATQANVPVSGWLFSPFLTLDELYSACANILGIQEKTLRRRVQRYIKDNRLRDYVAKPRVARG